MAKIIVSAMMIMLFLSGCAFKANSAKRALDYTGIYIGTLPCADCKGIRTLIKVYDNGIYEKEVVYLGEKINTYYSKGRYSWHPNGNIIWLDDATSYFVKKNKLFMLDKDDNFIKGALQDMYVLSKFGIEYVLDNPKELNEQ